MVDNKLNTPLLNTSKLQYDFSGNVTILAYPNPATTSWFINCKDFEKCSFTLINLQGNTVSKGIVTAKSFYLPADQLPAGIYYLQLYNGKEERTVRLIKD
jgi:hypothetical protein